MGVRILIGKERGTGPEIACLFCSTAGLAFGPIIRDRDGYDAETIANLFLEWYPGDPRLSSQTELEEKYGEFLRTEWPEWMAKTEEENKVFKAMHSRETENYHPNM